MPPKSRLTTEVIEQDFIKPADQRLDHAVALIMSETMADFNGQSDLYKSIEYGPDLWLPSNYLKEDGGIAAPSIEVVSRFKGAKASIVDIHATDKKLSRLYEDTVSARKGNELERRVWGMVHEMIVAILDTGGANGIHHIHSTVFPGTVYYKVKRGNGTQPNSYITHIGSREDGSPVYSMVTATHSKQAEYELFNYIGAGGQKKKRGA